MWREVLTDLPDFRIELIEVELHSMGRASGADIRSTVFQVVTFRRGKVARVEGHRHRADALEAAAASPLRRA
jgi:hypothetical protein